MKLYHHCRPSDLESIAEKGLYPHASESPIMSVGCEVAWLTTQGTTEADETDIEHFHRLRLPKEQVEQIARNGWLLDTSRTHRLTVRIRSGGRLKQYGEWLHSSRDRPIIENGLGRANDDGELYSVKHLIEGLSPNALSTWWVYFGRIPPSMIEGPHERIKKKKKPRAIEEDTALEIALNKLIRSETTTVVRP
jgi:hypothetical protein